MQIIGLVGLTCSGKTTALNYFKSNNWITIDLGDIIRETYYTSQSNENIFEWTIKTHNLYGNSWSLLKAIDRIRIQDNTKLVFSGIRFEEQLKILRLIDKDFSLINILAEKEMRFQRFKNRNRGDSGVSRDDFEMKDFIELNKYHIKSIIPKCNLEIFNNGNLKDFEKELLGKIK
ncbi:hypothetical protein [Sporocytophaga myxococcoides]|uniref:hypothetical protein n=1 Tax=Sporocytophaga myxococcoides TaxID=153721 RepID=UPI000417B5EA|nr:hypothetical protein [Sporocytophaga myxococcoides]